MNILLVAPSAICGFIEAGLQEEGHHVTCTDDIAEAILRLTPQRPDVVILDAPLSGAVNLARECRQREQALLLLTAPGEVSDAEALTDQCLTRPFKFDELLRSLPQPA